MTDSPRTITVRPDHRAAAAAILAHGAHYAPAEELALAADALASALDQLPEHAAHDPHVRWLSAAAVVCEQFHQVRMTGLMLTVVLKQIPDTEASPLIMVATVLILHARRGNCDVTLTEAMRRVETLTPIALEADPSERAISRPVYEDDISF